MKIVAGSPTGAPGTIPANIRTEPGWDITRAVRCDYNPSTWDNIITASQRRRRARNYDGVIVIGAAGAKSRKLRDGQRVSEEISLFVFDLEVARLRSRGAREIGYVVPGNWKECWIWRARRAASVASIHHGFGITRSFHPPWYVLYTASAFPGQPVRSGKSAINNAQPACRRPARSRGPSRSLPPAVSPSRSTRAKYGKKAAAGG